MHFEAEEIGCHRFQYNGITHNFGLSEIIFMGEKQIKINEMSGLTTGKLTLRSPVFLMKKGTWQERPFTAARLEYGSIS